MIGIKLIRETKGSGLQGMIDRLPQAAESGVRQALSRTRDRAADNLRQMDVHPLDVSPAQVKTDFRLVGDTAAGRVWVDSDRALFIEFGTGTFAEMPHVGVTKTFRESNYALWLLPVEKADRDYGDDRIYEAAGQRYYLMFPQRPHPFMRTAAFEGRDDNVQAVLDSISQMIATTIGSKGGGSSGRPTHD